MIPTLLQQRHGLEKTDEANDKTKKATGLFRRKRNRKIEKMQRRKRRVPVLKPNPQEAQSAITGFSHRTNTPQLCQRRLGALLPSLLFRARVDADAASSPTPCSSSPSRHASPRRCKLHNRTEESIRDMKKNENCRKEDERNQDVKKNEEGAEEEKNTGRVEGRKKAAQKRG